jgi:ferrous iron transport protein B
LLLLGLYVLGIAAAFATAWLFKRTLLKGPATSFILEMPSYTLPQLRQVVRVVWTNTAAFLTKAGTIIFALSIVIWTMTYYPRLSSERIAQVTTEAAMAAPAPEAAGEFVDQALASAQLRHSFAGRFGTLIEPAIQPLGFDWKMGVGLVGAFAAREIFVSTIGIVYSVGDTEDDTAGLRQAMLADTYADGRPVWTPLVAISLLVWFVIAMQCMSTLAIVHRETGGWRWPMFMMLYMNAVAYGLSFTVFQIGSRLGYH